MFLYDNGRKKGMATKMTQSPLTVIDIGTSKVSCLLVQADDSAQGFRVLGHSFHDCSGLARGAVVDIDETVRVLKLVAQEVQQQSKLKIRDVVIGISGHHVCSLVSNGMVGIRNREVMQGDVERVLDAAKAVAIPDNQSILHVLPQEYSVDDQDGVHKPVGMSGVRLEARVLLITVATSALQNLIKCVEFCGLRVKKVIAQQLASCHAVLTDDEQDLGVCLLDIGGGTTDIAVCRKQSLAYVSAVPIAGEHVTNDIAVALCTPPRSAEAIKIEHGKILARSFEGAQSIQVASLSNQAIQKVSAKLLSEVIEARYQEILSFVRKNLQAKNQLSALPGGIVLTGGGAQMPGLAEYAGKVFNCQVRIAEPEVIINDSPLVDSRYAAVLGLVLQAIEEHDTLDNRRAGMIGRMWKRFQYWLEYHL